MNLSRPLKFTLISSLLLAILGCSGWRTALEKRRLGQHLFTRIAESGIPWTITAESVEGRPIFLLDLGQGDSTTLIFGGFHGSEMSGVDLVTRLADYLYNFPDSLTCRVVIVPALNPDGLLAGTRVNANSVDINRNFPTTNWTPRHRSPGNYPGLSPASEPETRAVISLIETYSPQRIVSVHAPLEVVNYDGPALSLAIKMAEHNGYPVDSDIGYATPGSFGTYAGKEKQIPTITLELPRHTSFDINWERNMQALLATLSY